MLSEHHIDLILLDIYMPGKNGLELLTEIRKQNESVDVIVISAASELDVIKNASVRRRRLFNQTI